ncbi:hypothetical protein [Pseudobacteriovorax antillogorgiicola]|uniref:DNA-directed RNA polymerase specialized sigma subunit, sigma24 family n=1 Tax=Pseudobacteriovorax antillogorgiicola TaxID=1513793 RepID=A0A1Y6B789_9BACT|nr:hypothetical protein [Pseudobacteriovorax antillogorgiicola]TCS58633.1 hypothetical protein EDD56_102146 [Pseudobacteriovorax antillogorgiicola]SME96581.1 hypothetical protein SAMN06296036_102297 [Pseudobacteriovorax antillogorgiicola]
METSQQSQPQTSTMTGAWFETQKALLYDFMVRMTGDPQRMTTILLEVVRAVQDQAKEQGWDQAQCKIKLYQTAKNFCADRWYKPPQTALDGIYQGTNAHDKLREIEELIISFGPFEREVLLLRYRYGFGEHDIAQIVKKKPELINEKLKQLMKEFKRSHKEEDTKSLLQFPLFQIEKEEYSTVALSELFEPQRGDYLRILKSLFWFLGILGMLYLYWHYG